MKRIDSKKSVDKSLCLHPRRIAFRNPVTGNVSYVYLPCGMCTVCASRDRGNRDSKFKSLRDCVAD